MSEMGRLLAQPESAWRHLTQGHATPPNMGPAGRPASPRRQSRPCTDLKGYLPMPEPFPAGTTGAFVREFLPLCHAEAERLAISATVCVPEWVAGTGRLSPGIPNDRGKLRDGACPVR